MGGVQISGNIKKESVRIDPSGNIINAKTKEIISPVEPEFVPPVTGTTPVVQSPVELPKAEVPKASKLDELISKKVEEIINRKIIEALENL